MIKRARLVTQDALSVTFWTEGAMNARVLISSLPAIATSGADYLRLSLSSNLVAMVAMSVRKTSA